MLKQHLKAAQVLSIAGASYIPKPASKSPRQDIRAPGMVPIGRALDGQWQRVLALVLSDLVALVIAGKLAALFNRFYSPLPPGLDWGLWLGLPGLYWAFAGATLLVFAYSGLYSGASQSQNYVRCGQLVSLVYLSSLVLKYFYDPMLNAPRSLFFTAWVSSVVLVVGLRLVTTLVLRQLHRHQAQQPVFLIATADRLATLARTLKKRAHCRIVGAALAATANTEVTLQAILRSGAREVLVENLPQTELASALYWQLRRSGITLRLLPSSLEVLHRRGIPEVFAGIPTLRVEAPFLLLNGLDYRLKRLLDFVGALIGVILLSPLMFGIGIAIKLSSPGPILYYQERMGLQGRVFQMWKFRTMVADADRLQAALEAQNETKDGVMFKLRRDPRVTAIGAFLRRTSLDELPQLFNILLGQMSLVGPRPLPLRDVERFDPWHHVRHQVLPGITGLWQVSGRSDLDDFSHVVRLDLYYIDNWSLNLDFDILIETVRIVLFGKGAY